MIVYFLIYFINFLLFPIDICFLLLKGATNDDISHINKEKAQELIRPLDKDITASELNIACNDHHDKDMSISKFAEDDQHSLPIPNKYFGL